jgi:hypothetical protein
VIQAIRAFISETPRPVRTSLAIDARGEPDAERRRPLRGTLDARTHRRSPASSSAREPGELTDGDVDVDP